MGKAEKFISDCTRNCSNYTGVINKKNYEGYYFHLLTPDDARNAVEIAREEIYEWLNKNVHLYIEPIETIVGRIKVFNTDKLIKDLKQAMNDETQNL